MAAGAGAPPFPSVTGYSSTVTGSSGPLFAAPAAHSLAAGAQDRLAVSRGCTASPTPGAPANVTPHEGTPGTPAPGPETVAFLARVAVPRS